MSVAAAEVTISSLTFVQDRYLQTNNTALKTVTKTCCSMFRRSRSTDFTCAVSQAVRILNICKTFHEIQVSLNFLFKFTEINLVQLNINPVEFHLIRLCSFCNIYMSNDVKFFETPVFCELKSKTAYFSWLDGEEWMLFLAYICDIFKQLSKLNIQIQGSNTNIIKFVDAFKIFTLKLSNWKQKIQMQNYSMFEKLDLLLDNRKNKLPVQIENGILKHSSKLESAFEKYFPEITNDKLYFVRNPFTIAC